MMYIFILAILFYFACVIFKKHKKPTKIIIFFGPPLVGKGTQSKLIESKMRMSALSTGDLFRSISKDSPLGKTMNEYMEKGLLIPNDIIFQILEQELSLSKYRNGVILDGFPREMDNVYLLDKICEKLNFKVFCAFNLCIDEKLLFERLEKREQEQPSRPDNNIDVYKKRLEIFKTTTIPVINYYKKQGILIDIDSNSNISAIGQNIVESIQEFKN